MASLAPAIAPRSPATIQFSRGVPPPEAIPAQELAAIARSVVTPPAPRVFQYAPSDGFLGDAVLREAVAARHAADASQVFIGNGSLQILDLIATLLIGADRDVVIVERPSYDRAIRIFGRRGGETVGIPLHHDGVDVEALEAQLRKGRTALIYLIPDFQNPTGVTTSLAKRLRISALAAEYNVTVIEDTPYRQLRLTGAEQPLFSELRSGARVITLGSLSKTVSPGLRIGYAIAEARFARQLADLATDIYLSPAPLCQSIAAECFSRGLVERNIDVTRDLLRPKWSAAIACVQAQFADSCIAVPEGGFFLGLMVRSRLTERELIAAAASEGVVLTPGSAFFPRNEQPAAGTVFLRLPFHALQHQEFETGLTILHQIIRS
jgi:DNA-binding transcriptional MocR family regulator